MDTDQNFSDPDPDPQKTNLKHFFFKCLSLPLYRMQNLFQPTIKFDVPEKCLDNLLIEFGQPLLVLCAVAASLPRDGHLYLGPHYRHAGGHQAHVRQPLLAPPQIMQDQTNLVRNKSKEHSVPSAIRQMLKRFKGLRMLLLWLSLPFSKKV